MLAVRYSSFGHQCWLVSRQAVHELHELHHDLVELDAVAACWSLRGAWPLVDLRHLPRVESDSRSALDELELALRSGDLLVFTRPNLSLPLTMEEPAELLTDLLDEPIVEPERHFIEVRLLDEDGNPKAGEPYHVILPDNTEQSGTLDSQGVARLPSIASGICRWSFPELAPEQWARGA